MIIRKKNISSKKNTSSKINVQTSRGNVIKKEDIIPKKEDVILDTENIEDTTKENDIPIPIKKTIEPEVVEQETFEKIDISSIEFKERIERRRGDRRRGYRRIDERSLVSRAQQEAHSIKELAAREGYQNGLKKAQNEINEIKSSLIEFLAMRNEVNEKYYPHILEISMEIAKKIIKKEVDLSQDVLKNIIMSVLDEMSSDTQKIIIKVNSSDLEFAQASLPEIIKEKNISAKVSVQKDDSIETGSCTVTADNGVIDANFKTQLAVLQSAFGIYKGGL